jgi:hypothetical protein
MPSEAELLASIRRWLVAGVLALGLVVFQLSAIQQGVAVHQGGLPDLMRLVGFLIAVAALVTLVNADWERYR